MTFNLENQHCAPPLAPKDFWQISTFLHGKFQKNLNMGTICLQTSLIPIYLRLQLPVHTRDKNLFCWPIKI